jgi:hypothetical protein
MARLLLCLLAGGAWAQAPQVGEINVYGLRRVPASRILAAAQVREGQSLPPSKGDLETRLERVMGVVASSVQVECCDAAGRAILFIGVEERGAPHFAPRSDASGNASLPQEVLEAHAGLLEAARRGVQAPLADVAAAHLAALRDCLRQCSIAEQRAATVMGSAPRPQEVVGDLQYALQDASESVRQNAARSLAAMAAREATLRIPATWFVEMLNSLILSDRLEAAGILVTLTERDTAALDQIRRRALDSVLEMARWKSLRYALPAFLLAGRLAGVADAEVQRAWSEGRREEVLAKLSAVRLK